MFTRLRNLFTKQRISDVAPPKPPISPYSATHDIPSSVASEVRVTPRDPQSNVLLPPRGRRSSPLSSTSTHSDARPFHSDPSRSHLSDSIPVYVPDYTTHSSSRSNHTPDSTPCNHDSGSSSSDSCSSSSSD